MIVALKGLSSQNLITFLENINTSTTVHIMNIALSTIFREEGGNPPFFNTNSKIVRSVPTRSIIGGIV